MDLRLESMTGNTERDELAELTDLLSGPELWEDFGNDIPEFQPTRGADAVLAAGYRKPRTITTGEELDTLPEGTIILDKESDAVQNQNGYWHSTDGHTFDAVEQSEYLPAVVLWEPNA